MAFHKISFCFLVVIMISSCTSIEKYNKQISQPISVHKLHEDIDKLYTQLKRHHPRLYQFTPKERLDYKFDSLKKAITKPMESREFYKQLAQVTKYVGQGHMTIVPPSKRFNRKERKKLNKLKFDINNLDFEYLKDTLFISNARGNDSILKHAQVLKVDNKDVKDLIQLHKKSIASDGFNTTFKDRYAGRGFLSQYYYHNGRFDSIALKFRLSDSIFTKTYKRTLKKKNQKKDTLNRDSISKPKKLTKAQKREKRLKRKLRDKNRKIYGYNPTTKQNNRNLSFVGKDSTIALLTIKRFGGGGKKYYQSFYENTFKTLHSLKTKHLIIDLRNNLGGRLNEIQWLYSFLTDTQFTLIKPSETNSRTPFLKLVMSNTRSGFSKAVSGLFSPVILTHNLLKTSKKEGQIYYNFKASKPHEPQLFNFKGKIYVLINGNSFSASSILSTQLKGTNRATFVGEETGGAYNGTVAGHYKSYALPNSKIRARIGLMLVDTKYKTKPDGYGIKPDIEITPTYNDRLNNTDPELEWVLNTIAKKEE